MSEQLYCGWSRADITPKVPVSLAGYFNVRIWDKVLDRLEVRAIVFKQNGKYAAIINMDLVSCCQLLVDRIFPKIADLDMFSKENILFCATHTHTGPEIRFSHLPGSEECGEQIAEATSQALRAALADLQVVDGMVQGETYDNRFIFNRRYWMKSGGVVTNPGKFNPDILRPEGTVDPEIPLIGVKRNGKLALLIANIVNHSDTIGGNGVSADWPGFARRTVESQLGEGAMFVPIIGTAGNINHFDVASDLNQTCYAEAERIGTGIGATILNALDSLKPCCEMPLESRFTEVYVPGHEVSDEEYNEALATVEKYKDEPDVSASDDLTSEDLARKLPKVLKHFAKQVLILRDEPKTPPSRCRLSLSTAWRSWVCRANPLWKSVWNCAKIFSMITAPWLPVTVPPAATSSAAAICPTSGTTAAAVTKPPDAAIRSAIRHRCCCSTAIARWQAARSSNLCPNCPKLQLSAAR